MNLPNKLTMLRVFMIPFYIFFMMTTYAGSASPWIALGIFIVASLTDLLDGKIARKYNLVTNFGKFMDPLADKLLVCSALICFVELGILPAWFVIVIIAREFIISGFRLIASDNGVVIAASMWGKVKTVFQMVMTIFLMIIMGCAICSCKGAGIGFDGLRFRVILGGETNVILECVGMFLCYGAFILTIVSLVDYLVKNKAVMKDQK